MHSDDLIARCSVVAVQWWK